jgi:hypothetical protein
MRMRMRVMGITVTTTIPAIMPHESPACCDVPGVIDPSVLIDVMMGSVLRSSSVRFFASKWGNRNRNRLRTNPGIDEPQPDRLEPVWCGS